MAESLFTAHQLAQILKISEQSIVDYTRSGLIPFVNQYEGKYM